MNYLRLLRLAEKQTCNLIRTPSAKYASQPPLRFLETQDMWKRKDGVSKRWQLIYKGPMDTALNFASTYLTFSTTSIAIGTAYYTAFVFDFRDMDKPVMLSEDIVLANNPAECLVYLGAFIALHLAVKVLISKYVLRLYQDGDEYLAVFRGHFFNSIKTHKFHLKDFKKLSPTFVVSWGDARFDLRNKHGIILENYFKTPEHFLYLLYKDKRHYPYRDD